MKSLVKKKKIKLLIQGIGEDQMLYLYLKKGSSDDLGNLRAVSFASVSGKLVGIIIKKQRLKTSGRLCSDRAQAARVQQKKTVSC